MLTQRELCIGPWVRPLPAESHSTGPFGWVRWITGSGGQLPLGFVRLVRGRSWLGLAPQRLEICESEDASLLATLEHGWLAFGHWHVLDAEQSRVGGIVGAHIIDERGFRLATLWDDGPGRSIIRGRSDRVFTRLETTAGGGTLIRFEENVDVNPFLRMVLLGACVLQRPEP